MVCLAYGWVLSIRLVGLHPTFSRHGIAQILSALGELIWLDEKIGFTASVFGGAGDGKKEMLRKKTHVVRKKSHVVRKLFYVASIFGGVAGRKNMPPWELSSTAWELSSTAGDFLPTALPFDVYLTTPFRPHIKTPCFGGAD